MRCFKWKLVLRIVPCFVFSNISVIFEKVMLIPGFDSPNDVLNDFKTKAFRERLAGPFTEVETVFEKMVYCFRCFGIVSDSR